jgi:hypothetical protein
MQVMQFHTVAQESSVQNGRNFIGCRQFMDLLNAGTGALQRLIMCDSAHICHCGYLSKQNCQYWGDKHLCHAL